MYKPLLIKQFSKYSLIGLGNFIITGLLYFLLDFYGVNYITNFITTWLIGIFITYSANYIWVFQARKKLVFDRMFLKYSIIYILSFVVNYVLLKYLVEYWYWKPLLAQFCIIPIVVIINFTGMKYWSFK
jgi:putative flippase GtrA